MAGEGKGGYITKGPAQAMALASPGRKSVARRSPFLIASSSKSRNVCCLIHTVSISAFYLQPFKCKAVLKNAPKSYFFNKRNDVHQMDKQTCPV